MLAETRLGLTEIHQFRYDRGTLFDGGRHVSLWFGSMIETVSIPFWLFFILAALSLLALTDRLLLPGARWFFRRKINRVLEQINDRLQIEIQPFKLTQRQSLIDRLVYDSQVLAQAEKRAFEQGVSRETVMAEVKTYAREIVPAFNAYLYFRVAYWLSKKIVRSLYRVRLGFSNEEALRAVPANASVIFIMNHRSNMDYILVTFFAASRTALSYAVGEWARIWPLQTLIRSLGAYFVRRRSGNQLYRKVLERYVQIATAEGVTQAVFPEGGLSRDGGLQQPKLGLLDYLLRAYDPSGERDLVFIPVGVNYDRTLEDRTLLLDGGPTQIRKGMWLTMAKTFRFVCHQLKLMVKGQWHRFGYACVNFGAPISMKDYLAREGIDFRKMDRETRFEHIAVLAEKLMVEIGGMIPVLPVSLVATVLKESRQTWLDGLELKARVNQLIQRLEALGAHIYLPREDRDYAVTVGLRMLTLRRLVETRNGLYRVAESHKALINYYAQSLDHFNDQNPLKNEGTDTPPVRAQHDQGVA